MSAEVEVRSMFDCNEARFRENVLKFRARVTEMWLSIGVQEGQGRERGAEKEYESLHRWRDPQKSRWMRLPVESETRGMAGEPQVPEERECEGEKMKEMEDEKVVSLEQKRN